MLHTATVPTETEVVQLLSKTKQALMHARAAAVEENRLAAIQVIYEALQKRDPLVLLSEAASPHPNHSGEDLKLPPPTLKLLEAKVLGPRVERLGKQPKKLARRRKHRLHHPENCALKVSLSGPQVKPLSLNHSFSLNHLLRHCLQQLVPAMARFSVLASCHQH